GTGGGSWCCLPDWRPQCTGECCRSKQRRNAVPAAGRAANHRSGASGCPGRDKRERAHPAPEHGANTGAALASAKKQGAQPVKKCASCVRTLLEKVRILLRKVRTLLSERCAPTSTLSSLRRPFKAAHDLEERQQAEKEGDAQ